MKAGRNFSANSLRMSWVLPPHRPDLNSYVERYHRTYQQACLLVCRPSTLEEARHVTEAFQQHYNEQRPHQGRSCRNQPPRQAFPVLPSLPALPAFVDPDAWVQAIHGRTYPRRVTSDGRVSVDGIDYSIKQALAGQQITLRVNAPERSLEVLLQDTLIKVLPIKGLLGRRMPLDDDITLMQERARSEERQRLINLHRRLIQAR
jgi:hypothetical protein